MERQVNNILQFLKQAGNITIYVGSVMCLECIYLPLGENVKIP